MDILQILDTFMPLIALVGTAVATAIGWQLKIIHNRIDKQAKERDKVVAELKDIIDKKADHDDMVRIETEFKVHDKDGIKVREDIASIKTNVENILKQLDKMNGRH